MIGLALLSLSGSAQAEDTCPVATPGEQAAEIWRLDVQGEHHAAAQAMAAAYACLGSMRTLAEPVELGHLLQWGGTAALHDEDAAAASRYFQAAARLSGAIGFDPRLGDAAHTAYTAAQNAVVSGGGGTVHANAEVWLDGVRLNAGQDRVVPTGAHLVQAYDRENLVQTALQTVPVGGAVAVGTGVEAVVAPVVAPRKRHLGRTLGGAALLAGGTVALVVSGERGWGLYSQPLADQQGEVKIINGLNLVGIAGVALGTAGLMANGFTSFDATSSTFTFAIPVLVGRW